MARSRKPAPRRTSFADATVYLVRRLYEPGWESIFCNSAAYECPERFDSWGGPVRAYASRGRADDTCRELTEKRRGKNNPFESCFEKLEDLTHFPPGPFRDWLLDAGLTPPPAGKDRLRDWAQWWTKGRAKMTAGQRDRVWAGLNKVHFYDVADLEPPPDPPPAAKGKSRVTVFTVELRDFKDDDDFLAGQDADWLASYEPCFSMAGLGLGLATFRDRSRADAYCDELRGRLPREFRRYMRNQGFGVTEHEIEVEG